MQVPSYYLTIMPYLIVEKAHDFKQFVETVFGAEERMIVRRPDTSIMHGELTIGHAAIMFTDASADYPPFPCSMFLLVKNVDEVYSKGLLNGAISLQEIDDREYGRSAGFKDAWGNVWWITQTGE